MINLVVIVKDELTTPAMVATAVANATAAYFMSEIKRVGYLRDDTAHPVYDDHDPLNRSHCDDNGVLLYKNPVLYALAKQAAAEGKTTFHSKLVPVEGNTYVRSKTVACEPDPYIDARLRLAPTIAKGLEPIVLFMQDREGIDGAIAAARGLGWRDDKDYFSFDWYLGFRPMSLEEYNALIQILGTKSRERILKGGLPDDTLCSDTSE